MSPFAPLPGTTPTPRALFVDRWGTLLQVPEDGVPPRPEELEFTPGAVEALFRARQAGWQVYLIGNEDAVAYGHITQEAWKELEVHFLGLLADAGVGVARQYACLTRQDGVEKQHTDSVYLLPNTGAFYHASHIDGIDLAKSWVVGDSSVELVAGWRSGCRVAAVRTGLGLSDGTFEVEPEIFCDDLAGVIALLLAGAERAA